MNMLETLLLASAVLNLILFALYLDALNEWGRCIDCIKTLHSQIRELRSRPLFDASRAAIEQMHDFTFGRHGER